MTCVECGAEMRTASACARCGAPVPRHMVDKAGDRASQQDTLASPPPNPGPADSFMWGGCLVMSVLFSINFVAVVSLIAAVAYVIKGSPGPGQAGQDFFPLRVSVIWALVSVTVPALTVIGLPPAAASGVSGDARLWLLAHKTHYRRTQADPWRKCEATTSRGRGNSDRPSLPGMVTIWDGDGLAHDALCDAPSRWCCPHGSALSARGHQARWMVRRTAATGWEGDYLPGRRQESVFVRAPVPPIGAELPGQRVGSVEAPWLVRSQPEYLVDKSIELPRLKHDHQARPPRSCLHGVGHTDMSFMYLLLDIRSQVRPAKLGDECEMTRSVCARRDGEGRLGIRDSGWQG
jgi:hypothetical protein